LLNQFPMRIFPPFALAVPLRSLELHPSPSGTGRCRCSHPALRGLQLLPDAGVLLVGAVHPAVELVPELRRNNPVLPIAPPGSPRR
jgi:hypothetical protein